MGYAINVNEGRMEWYRDYVMCHPSGLGEHQVVEGVCVISFILNR